MRYYTEKEKTKMEKQELYCHECTKYVRFDVPETNGNLVVVCPNCGHEHCRVIREGVITDERWSSRSGGYGMTATITVSNGTTANASFVGSYSLSASNTTSATVGASSFLAQSWLNSTSA